MHPLLCCFHDTKTWFWPSLSLEFTIYGFLLKDTLIYLFTYHGLVEMTDGILSSKELGSIILDLLPFFLSLLEHRCFCFLTDIFCKGPFYIWLFWCLLLKSLPYCVVWLCLIHKHQGLIYVLFLKSCYCNILLLFQLMINFIFSLIYHIFYSMVSYSNLHGDISTNTWALVKVL